MGKKEKFTNITGLIKVGERQKADLYKQAKVSDEHIKKHIQINEELRTLIPPLTTTEYEKLEENIQKEGCRDPLVLWQDGENYILVDGHNRFGICVKHQLDFSFVILPFEHINQVKDWMLENQFGKRNITEDTKSYLRGMQYAREKNKVGTNQYSNNVENTENLTENTEGNTKENINIPQEKKIRPLENLALQHKVSTKTIQRDEKYFLGLTKLTEDDEVFRWQILQAELPITRSKIVEMLENEHKKEYAENLGELGKKIKAIEDIIRQEQRFDLSMLEKSLEKLDKNETQDEIKEIPKNSSVTEKHLKSIAKNIKNCLRLSLEEQSLDAISELRNYLNELEEFIKNNGK